MIYGSLVQEKYDEFVLEQFSVENYIIESDEIINRYFGEANDLVVRKDVYTADDSEYSIKDSKNQDKKSLVEIIKDLLNKLIITIRNLFNKFIEKIQDIYLKLNFKDKFLSKFKEIITETNYITAKKNGWKGFTLTQNIILRFPSFGGKDISEDRGIDIGKIFDKVADQGSDFVANFQYIKDEGQEIINNIINSESDDELKKEKDKFLKFLVEHYIDTNSLDYKNITSKLISYLRSEGSIGYLDSYDNKHYFPQKFSDLIPTIFFATHGEENIKKLKINNNKYLNSMKDKFKVVKNYKLDDNATIYQKEGFKCTIQLYQYLMKHLAYKSGIIYSIYSFYYRESINTFIALYNGIKKYASIEKSTK